MATHLKISEKWRCMMWKITDFSTSTPVRHPSAVNPRENSYRSHMLRNFISRCVQKVLLLSINLVDYTCNIIIYDGEIFKYLLVTYTRQFRMFHTSCNCVLTFPAVEPRRCTRKEIECSYVRRVHWSYFTRRLTTGLLYCPRSCCIWMLLFA